MALIVVGPVGGTPRPTTSRIDLDGDRNISTTCDRRGDEGLI